MVFYEKLQYYINPFFKVGTRNVREVIRGMKKAMEIKIQNDSLTVTSTFYFPSEPPTSLNTCENFMSWLCLLNGLLAFNVFLTKGIMKVI